MADKREGRQKSAIEGDVAVSAGTSEAETREERFVTRKRHEIGEFIARHLRTLRGLAKR